MSYQEKRSVVTLISSIVIFSLFWFFVYNKYSGKNFTIEETLVFWGTCFLIFIPISIVSRIIIHIFFVIFYRISTREQEPSFADELDKLIELKATRNSSLVFAIGFLLGMVSLTLKMPVSVMFITFIISGFFAEMVEISTQLYLYRKGIR